MISQQEASTCKTTLFIAQHMQKYVLTFYVIKLLYLFVYLV